MVFSYYHLYVWIVVGLLLLSVYPITVKVINNINAYYQKGTTWVCAFAYILLFIYTVFVMFTFQATMTTHPLYLLK